MLCFFSEKLQIRELEKKKCCVSSVKTRKEQLQIKELEKEKCFFLLKTRNEQLKIKELEKENCCASS
jgi:hypothetical protein